MSKEKLIITNDMYVQSMLLSNGFKIIIDNLNNQFSSNVLLIIYNDSTFELVDTTHKKYTQYELEISKDWGYSDFTKFMKKYYPEFMIGE